jgi:undecaprenyl diphosphate synthase
VEELKDNKKFIFNIALNYGGRDEIVRALKKIMKRGIGADEISEELMSKNLDTEGMPDPDLIIRTGKVQRTSNFLIWQAAYAELYFPSIFWPEFDESELDKAISEYGRRKRRFGGNDKK